ncbi:MAG: APC family permease [Ignavibacteria bacterium]|nr:APC family permease [Ignavibacteria bacterium]
METSEDESQSGYLVKKKSLIKVTRAIVLTTVMFTFISFLRAAAIVIGDLGSTAYYIEGISEQFIGEVAPYFILMVMIFAFVIGSLYLESSPLYTRGGVYRVVKFALGARFAKISVSALVFDYILTGPISSVSGGQYLTGLINDTFHHLGYDFALDRNIIAMLVAVIIIIYFWRENVKGIEESSDKALKIFIITAAMAFIVIIWGIVTLLLKDEPFFSHLPEFHLNLREDAFGWLSGVDWIKTVTVAAVIIAFGHSLLALSGLETMGQVYREVEYPKLINFRKAYITIFAFALIVTPSISFLGVMLIPDGVRHTEYMDNIIGGIAMFLAGPVWLRLVVQVFVVLVGVLILSGAVNTSIVGANSVLNRVSEDKILTDWFRKPHPKYGTTYRILTLIAGLQIATIILSGGNILILGEAYAFGVIWSLTFKAFAMIVLRYRDKRPREWRVPVNIKIGKTHIPIGIITIFLILFISAIANFFTKPIATVSGLSFTIVFFSIFAVSEYINKKKIMKEEELTEEEFETEKKKRVLEHFKIEGEDELSAVTIESEKEDRILVAVKDPNNLSHLEKVLNEVETENTDVIVMIGRVFSDKQNTIVDSELQDDEKELFSAVVDVSERIGKRVITIVVPTNNAFYSIINTAYILKVRELILGLSAKFKPDVQLQQLAILWGAVNSDENYRINIRIITRYREFRAKL